MIKKIVVYTALFGDYDVLQEPDGSYECCDFICFTDQQGLNSAYWKFVYVDGSDNSPTLLNREYKILPHKYLSQYSTSIYIDANIKLHSDPAFFANELLEGSIMVCPEHFLRDCIYDEAQECYRVNKISKIELDNFLTICDRYAFPRHHGLTENNILLRRHMNEQCIQLMEQWWQLLVNGPRRDQLMLPLASWITEVKVNKMWQSSRVKNPYFSYELHKQDANKGFFHKFDAWISSRQKYSLAYAVSFKIYVIVNSLIGKINSRA